MSGMHPMRVRWTLSTPMIPPAGGIHLDGLLAHAVVRRTLGSDVTALAGEGLSIRDVAGRLPLEQYRTQGAGDDQWVWKASLIELDAHPANSHATITGKTSLDHMTRMFCAGQISGRGLQINTGSGPRRSYLLRYPMLNVREATAYAVGDIDAVADLLGEIVGLGRKVVAGFGHIADCQVQPCAAEECRWWWRTMPHAEATVISAESFTPAMGNLRSPYWDRTAQEPVLVPVDAC